MENVLQVPDSTDWLNTPLAGLSPVEAALRCQVCKDFFTTPMITSCSHTFCSLCIRRCLASDGKCPTCRNAEQEVRLRRNWTVQELVDSFQRTRDAILRFAHQAAEEEKDDARLRTKRRMRDAELDDGGEAANKHARKTRSQSRLDAASMPEEAVDLVDDDTDEAHEPDDGLVPCPMCGRRMKEDSVYLHLDRCEQERNTPAPRKPSFPKASPQPPNLQSERLPKLNYFQIKEATLKKKLTELGMRASGSKSLLERRHTEWVNIWNANCDSSRPRPRRELLQDLDTWERSQGGLAPTSSSSTSSGNAVMRKDFDGAAWATNHNSDFQQLIANARRQKRPPNAPDDSPDTMSEAQGDQKTMESSEANPVGRIQPLADPSSESNGPVSDMATDGKSVDRNSDSDPRPPLGIVPRFSSLSGVQDLENAEDAIVETGSDMPMR